MAYKPLTGQFIRITRTLSRSVIVKSIDSVTALVQGLLSENSSWWCVYFAGVDGSRLMSVA